MKSKRLVAASAATLLSLGLVAAPAATAYAGPPGDGPGHGLLVKGGTVTIDKAAWKQAKAELKAALTAARKQFHVDIKSAISAFKSSTADERAALKAVLSDENSTDEQKQAAKEQYLADTADARATRKAAFVTAIKTWKAARTAAWQAFRDAVTS